MKNSIEIFFWKSVIWKRKFMERERSHGEKGRDLEDESYF